MGFKPTGYREIFIASEATTSSGTQKIDMVCTYPGKNDSTQDVKERDLVLSKSEMVVRYLNNKFWDGEGMLVAGDA